MQAFEPGFRAQKVRAQLAELRRWYEATLGREDRVIELKREVNELRARLGEPARYGKAKGGAESDEQAPPP